MLQHSPMHPGHALAPRDQQPGLTPTPASTSPGSGQGGNSFTDIEDFVVSIVNFLQILSFSVFALSIIIAGLMYMLSLNNDRHKAAAQGAIVTAVVGLIITLMATGLHTMLSNAFPTH
jgi:hypothetical protein